MPGKKLNLIGVRFSRLRVVCQVASDRHHRSMWRCRCDCGNTVTVAGAHLKSGDVKSCGCLRAEIMSRIGLDDNGKQTSLYMRWGKMIQRCTNPNDKNYARYGGRGITVCGEWRNSFAAFQEWAAVSGYDESLTLDRVDNDGNYEPANCRWVDWVTQANNRDWPAKTITYNGRTSTLTEWAKVTGLNRSTIAQRLDRFGWTVDRALTTPSRDCPSPRMEDQR